MSASSNMTIATCANCRGPLPLDHAANLNASTGERTCLGTCRPLHVWKNGVIDWVVATDPEHAARVWCEHTGYSYEEYVDEFGPPADEWEQVPADKTIAIRDYWDESLREERDLTKTAAEWAAHEGKPCFLCSTEY